MTMTNEYYQAIMKILTRIVTESDSDIQRAASLLADKIQEGRLIHVLGSGGHSFMGAEEMFFRAGSLQPVNAMLDAGLSLANGARRTTIIERTPGYGTKLLDIYGLRQGDVLIIINVNGINSVTIDAALEAKKRGITVIGLTSREFSTAIPKDTPARHASGQNLCDVADIVIDLKVPVGDAVLNCEGVD
ncbi:MAG: sugar isomerase domain-containing protein, partial [Firmicutes bacterium]|nr:sugar isomerase domain-containing protein [Bacillota bacterium]